MDNESHNEEPGRQESSPPSQSPIGTPLTNRDRLEPSKPPSAVAISPTAPICLSEPFRQPSQSPDLLTQKLQQPVSDDSSLMQPMNSTIHNTIEMPEQLKEILAPTPPSKSPPFTPQSQYDENDLVINNLPLRLTEEGFLDLFVQFGEIRSARLAMNNDGSSRGFGYVNFHTKEDALQAIKHYDGFHLWGQLLKASFASANNNVEGVSISIFYFPRSWGTSELRSCFEEFGEILDVTFLENQEKCVVRFLRQLDARVALSSRNGWVPPGHGHALKVRLGDTQTVPEPARVFPTNCSPNSETYEMPLNLFGGLYSPPRRFEQSSKPNRQHAAPPNHYQKKMQVRARTEKLKSARARTEKVKSAPPGRPCSEMVFLYNLPTFFQKAHVENFCSLYGNIISVSMQKDNTGCYLGMAYVVYSTQDEAKEAVQALNGCSMFKQTISATRYASSSSAKKLP